MGLTLLVTLLAHTHDQSLVRNTVSDDSNTASASSDTADPDPSNDSATATTTAVTPKADLEVSKTAPAAAIHYLDFSHLLSLTNHGPEDAHNVVLSDVLPLALSFVSFSFEAGDRGVAGERGPDLRGSVRRVAWAATTGAGVLVDARRDAPQLCQWRSAASGWIAT